VRYDFDTRGRLSKVKDWNNRLTTYSYDAVGRLEWTIRPNETKRHLSYDDAGQIKKIEELNKNGRIISLVSYPEYWGNGQPAKEFIVPALPLGARTHSASMLYDEENRVSSWNGQTLTHDADGNLLYGPLPPSIPGAPSPGLGSYQFDTRNRLLNCAGLSYTYDAQNLRTHVIASSSDAQWIINPEGSPPQPLVRTKNGVTTRYIWGIGLLYEEDATSQTTKTYHFDRRGSTLALTRDDGLTVTDRWSYGPYGEALSHSGTGDTPFLFNGSFGVQTDANGLLYMNARYYNVELRRFISADPLGFTAGTNFYWFADGDPISLSDPFGLCAESEFLGYTSFGDYWHDASDSLGGVAIGLTEGMSGGVIAIDNSTVAQMNEMQLAGYHSGLVISLVGAFLAPEATTAGENSGVTVIRTTRLGETAIRTTRPDGSVIDISPQRVKEFVPNTHPNAPAGALDKVKFDNALPGSKGYKRSPTAEELKRLNGGQ